MSAQSLLSLKIPADPKKLRMLREGVQECCEEAGCDKKIVSDIVIAVNEACMNIIQHAYKGRPHGEIIVEIRQADDKLQIEITDFAEPVAREQIKPRNLDDIKPGGLGTHFIQEIMDEICYEHLNDAAGNRLIMTKNIRQ